MSSQTVDIVNLRHSGSLTIPKFFTSNTPNITISVKSDQTIGDAFIAEAVYRTTQMDNSVVTNRQSLVSEDTSIIGEEFGNIHNEIDHIVFYTSPENVISGKITITAN